MFAVSSARLAALLLALLFLFILVLKSALAFPLGMIHVVEMYVKIRGSRDKKQGVIFAPLFFPLATQMLLEVCSSLIGMFFSSVGFPLNQAVTIIAV